MCLANHSSALLPVSLRRPVHPRDPRAGGAWERTTEEATLDQGSPCPHSQKDLLAEAGWCGTRLLAALKTWAGGRLHNHRQEIAQSSVWMVLLQKTFQLTKLVKFLFEIWSASQVFPSDRTAFGLGLYRMFSAYRVLDVFCRIRPSEISVVYSFLKLNA